MTTDHLQEAQDLVLRAEIAMDEGGSLEDGVPPHPDLDLRAAAAHALIDMATTLRRILDLIPPDAPTMPPVASAAAGRADVEEMPY